MNLSNKFKLLFFFLVIHWKKTTGEVQQVQITPERNLTKSIGNYSNQTVHTTPENLVNPINTYTKVVEESLNFLNTSVITAEVYRNGSEFMRKSMDNLEVAFQKANVMEYSKKVTIHFEEEVDIYNEIIQILIETCYSNIEIYESTWSMPSSKETGTINLEVSHLKNMSNGAVDQAVRAYHYMYQTMKNESDRLRALIRENNKTEILETNYHDGILNGLIEKITKKIEDSRSKCTLEWLVCWSIDFHGRNAAKKSISALLDAFHKTKIFLEDLEKYVNWLNGTKTNLTDEFDSYQKRVAEWKDQTFKSSTENMVTASNLLNKGLDTINNQSLNYLATLDKIQDFDEITYPSYSEKDYNKIRQHMNSSLSFLSAKSMKKVLALSMFFEVGIKNLGNIISYVKTKSNDFIKEIEAMHSLLTDSRFYFGNSPDLLAQIAWMTASWEDIVSILKRLKTEWNSYLIAVSNNYQRGLSIPELNDGDTMNMFEENLSLMVDQKTNDIVDSLNKFKLGMVDKVPYLEEKTTDLSHFAWSLVVFFKEILQDDNLSKIQIKELNVEKIVKHFETFSKERKFDSKSSEAIVQEMLSRLGDTSTDTLTKNKSFALVIFFEIGLKSLSKFGSAFKAAINYFLNEFKKIHTFLVNQLLAQQKDPDFVKIKVEMMQLTLLWQNIMYKLDLQKTQWYSLLSKIEPTLIRFKINTILGKINHLMDGFQNGTVKEISYHREKTTNLATIAEDIVTYSSKIL